MRRQEVFRGAETSLFNKPDGGVADVAALRRKFWQRTAVARRKASCPFLWTVVARKGQLFGNVYKGSRAKVANGLNFSYPGYNELLTGAPDPRIDSNEKLPNPNVTVFEWLNRKPGYHGKVQRRGIVGCVPVHFQRRAERPVHERGLGAIRRSVADRGPGHAEPTDGPVPADLGGLPGRRLHLSGCAGASPRATPRGLYIGLGDTDEHAHGGRTTITLRAAHDSDANLRLLWDELQSHPQYRGTTTMIVTTDHGRGDPPDGSRDHGKKTQGLRGDLDRRPRSGHARPRRADQHRARHPGPGGRDDRRALGEDYLADAPEAARPIADVIRRSSSAAMYPP